MGAALSYLLGYIVVGYLVVINNEKSACSFLFPAAALYAPFSWGVLGGDVLFFSQ